MPIDLAKTLSWKSANPAELAMLNDLQGNILGGHGRKSTRHLFIKFGADKAKARAFVHALAPLITSAQQQLLDAEAFQKLRVPGPAFVGFVISSAGYAALGVVAKAPQPQDGGAFAAGMLARANLLNDPPTAQLDVPYRDRLHAMILIGADPDNADSWDSLAAQNLETQILNLMGTAAQVVTTEVGRAIFKNVGTTQEPHLEGIEHFGYVDGRSQPLMLQENINRERDQTDGISVWDARFPIGQALVPDPGSPTPASAFGSFFVFRKLEQNVKGFKGLEESLGTDPGLGKLGELMGATLVGRFEDGTPVVLQDEEGIHNPVPNNFDYAGDPDGLRCPIHAHIRKTNPRGDSVRQFPGATLAQERSHIMARRGMTYGRRNQTVDPSDEPTGGVGLLFMAFQNNLANQFEFTQASWANNPDFLRPHSGRDPVIGQKGPHPSVKLQVRDTWGNRGAGTFPVTFEGFVGHKGGEYFFAPAKSTLAGL